VKWRNGDETLTDLSADVYNHTIEPTEEDTEGKYHYNATAAWQKKDGVLYQFTDQIEIPYVYSVTLEDNASNESVLANNEGNLVRSLTLYGRTFYHDGYWNTLCLPFSLSAEQLAEASCPLNGATLKKLASAEFSEGTLTLNFDDVTAVEPGIPYLVKWDDESEVSNPTFTDVFIASWQQTAGIGSDATFYGYYSPITLEAGDRTRLYMGSNNTLYYPADAVTVGSCRGIFQLHGITAGDLESGEVNNAPLRIVLNLDDAKGDATAISAVSNDPVVASPSGWFTLDGRRLADKPTLRGIYLHNGKKVVIK